MLVLLILTEWSSLVAGEWVEIAQNHYRKEPSRRLTISYEEHQNRLYMNHTVTERPRNRGSVTRIPNVGNVKRVHLPNRDEFSIMLHESTFTTERIIKKEYENFGSVRAPNLKNTNNVHGGSTNRKNNGNNITSDRFDASAEKFLNHGPMRPLIQRTQASPNIFQHSSNKVIETTAVQKHVIDDIYHETNSNTKRVQSIFHVEKPFLNDHSNLNGKKIDHQVDDRAKLRNSKIEQEYIKTSANDNFHEIRIDSNIDNDQNKSRGTLIEKKSPISDNNINEINRPKLDKIPAEQLKIENASNIIKDNKHQIDEGLIKDDKLDNKSKNNTVDILWKFMKVITDNISKNTRRSFKDKVKYLEVLRNNILMNIEEQIERTWPDNESRRRRREARGHVEFPSSESALMTISFLTFAVFLIKLVLQVIHTYKNKTMMVTPAVVAAVGRAAAALREQTTN